MAAHPWPATPTAARPSRPVARRCGYDGPGAGRSRRPDGQGARLSSSARALRRSPASERPRSASSSTTRRLLGAAVSTRSLRHRRARCAGRRAPGTDALSWCSILPGSPERIRFGTSRGVETTARGQGSEGGSADPAAAPGTGGAPNLAGRNMEGDDPVDSEGCSGVRFFTSKPFRRQRQGPGGGLNWPVHAAESERMYGRRFRARHPLPAFQAGPSSGRSAGPAGGVVNPTAGTVRRDDRTHKRTRPTPRPNSAWTPSWG